MHVANFISAWSFSWKKRPFATLFNYSAHATALISSKSLGFGNCLTAIVVLVGPLKISHLSIIYQFSGQNIHYTPNV
jgi:hypothetical protein